MKRTVFVILLCTLLLPACGPRGPSEEEIATQVAEQVVAQLTALAPSATPIPTNTPTPTSTSTPEPTSTPTPTTTPTTIVLTPTSAPTPTPTSVPRPPTPTPLPLKVEFLNPHYECAQDCWGHGRPPYQRVWGYRYFQADLAITNLTSDRTLDPPWEPSRWILTDGSNVWEETYAWQWGKWEGGKVVGFPQASIGPGQAAIGSFLCFPIPREGWVQAVEFEAWGHTYRQEFDLGPFKNKYNYRDCGEPYVSPWCERFLSQ